MGRRHRPPTNQRRSQRNGRYPWVSLLLSTVAFVLITVANVTGEVPPLIGVASFLALAVCCFILMAAELVHQIQDGVVR